MVVIHASRMIFLQSHSDAVEAVAFRSAANDKVPARVDQSHGPAGAADSLGLDPVQFADCVKQLKDRRVREFHRRDLRRRFFNLGYRLGSV